MRLLILSISVLILLLSQIGIGAPVGQHRQRLCLEMHLQSPATQALAADFIKAAFASDLGAPESMLGRTYLETISRLSVGFIELAQDAISEAEVSYFLHKKNLASKVRKSYLLGLLVRAESIADIEAGAELLRNPGEELNTFAAELRELTQAYIAGDGDRHAALTGLQGSRRRSLNETARTPALAINSYPYFGVSEDAGDMLTLETAVAHKLTLAQSPLFNDGVPFNLRQFRETTSNAPEYFVAQLLSAEGKQIIALGDESVRVFQTPGFGRSPMTEHRERACDFLILDANQNSIHLLELKTGSPNTGVIQDAAEQLAITYASLQRHRPEFRIDRLEILLDAKYLDGDHLTAAFKAKLAAVPGEPGRFYFVNRYGHKTYFQAEQQGPPLTVNFVRLQK